MDTFELPLISLRRERQKWLKKLPHTLPAFMLLGAGIARLKNGDQGWALALAIGELTVSILLLRLLVKDVIASRQPHAAPHHSKVEWFDIVAAAVLTAEALEHWHHTGHVPRPIVLSAFVALGLGLFHRELTGFIGPRRSLRIDEEGIRVRSRFRPQLFAPWMDVERIDLDATNARIVARGGAERRINLADMGNASEIRQALLLAQERLADRQPAGHLPALGTH